MPLTDLIKVGVGNLMFCKYMNAGCLQTEEERYWETLKCLRVFKDQSACVTLGFQSF